MLGANRPPDTGQQGVDREAERVAWNAEQARRREVGLPQMEHAPSAANAEAVEMIEALEQWGV